MSNSNQRPISIGSWVLCSAFIQLLILFAWPVDFGGSSVSQPASQIDIHLLAAPVASPPLVTEPRSSQSVLSRTASPDNSSDAFDQGSRPAEPAREVIYIDSAQDSLLAGDVDHGTQQSEDMSSAPASHLVEAVVVRAAPLSSGNVHPSYPRMARQRGWEGEVMLWVTVSQLGEVIRSGVEKTSGHEILDHSALKAVRTWRFSPAFKNGIPVESLIHVPVAFLLERS